MDTKINLEKICHELRQEAYRMLACSTGVLDPDLSLKRLELSGPVWEALDDPWFEEFIRHPQVDNLIADAVCYHFSHMQNRKLAGDGALMDQVCNRCLFFLQTVWAQTQGWEREEKDRVTRAFRQFWNQLLCVEEPEEEARKEYLEYIGKIFKQECQKRRVAIEQELEADFVPTPPGTAQTMKSYKKKLKALYKTGFVYMLGDYQFNEFYIPPTVLPEGAVLSSAGAYILRGQRDLWKNIFDMTNISYVIGVPGSGKSLFLQNVINNYEKMNFYRSEGYLVIKCDMKTYYTNGGSGAKSVVSFLQESIVNTLGMDQGEVSLDFIKYHLSVGRCLVLMDALDEVPKEKRKQLHKMVVSYFKEEHPGNKVIVTSRARGFIPEEKVEVYKICELSHQDIKDYIKKMIQLKKFKKEDEEKFLQQAQTLIDKHFLNNFLTLSLLTSIYKAEKELPENKVNLYKKCFEYIAKKREEEKVQLNYDWEKLGYMMKDSTFISLAELAAPNNKDIGRQEVEGLLMKLYRNKYENEAETERVIQQFLDFCSNRAELFVPAPTEEKFHFFHRSFFEYFYARLIAQKTSAEEMYRLMTQFDIDSEVFELTVALVKEENEEKYQQLIEYIFDKAESEFRATPPAFTAFGILTLSIRVIDDIGYHKRYFRIVAEHADVMDDPGVMALNQKLISFGIEKGSANSPEELQRFYERFHDQYISYVIKRMAAPSRNFRMDPRFVRAMREREGDFATSYVRARMEEAPFYVQNYPDEKAAELKSKVLGWNKADVSQFLSRTRGKERRLLQRGFDRFLKCGAEQRDELWAFGTGEAPMMYHFDFSMSSL